MCIWRKRTFVMAAYGGGESTSIVQQVFQIWREHKIVVFAETPYANTQHGTSRAVNFLIAILLLTNRSQFQRPDHDFNHAILELQRPCLQQHS